MQNISTGVQNWIAHVTDVLERHGHSAQLALILAAVIVGSVTGLDAVFFIWLLGQINGLATATTERFGIPRMLAFVTGAGVIVGFLIDRFASEAKGHGVPEVIEAVALRGGRIRWQVAAVKVVASAITIGSCYTLKLRLKGINWGGGRDLDMLQGVLIGEVARCVSLEAVQTDRRPPCHLHPRPGCRRPVPGFASSRCANKIGVNDQITAS